MTSKPIAIVVGNDIIVPMHLSYVLGRAGYDVCIASDCKAALDQVDGSTLPMGIRPEVVIIDLPSEIDAADLVDARKIQQQLDTPVIFIGANCQTDEETLPQAADWYRWLAKPIDENQLMAAISPAGAG